ALAAELLYLGQRREVDAHSRELRTVHEAREEVGPVLCPGIVDGIAVGDVDRHPFAGRGGERPAPRRDGGEPARCARGEDRILDRTARNTEVEHTWALELPRSRRRGAGS